VRTITVSVGSQRVGEYAGENNDCTVRALAAVSGIPYGAAHRSAELVGRKRNHGLCALQIDLLLGSKFANYKVERVFGTLSLLTIAQFAAMHPTGRYYVLVTGHALALVDGHIVDEKRPGGKTRVRHAWRFTAM